MNGKMHIKIIHENNTYNIIYYNFLTQIGACIKPHRWQLVIRKHENFRGYSEHPQFPRYKFSASSRYRQTHTSRARVYVNPIRRELVPFQSSNSRFKERTAGAPYIVVQRQKAWCCLGHVHRAPPIDTLCLHLTAHKMKSRLMLATYHKYRRFKIFQLSRVALSKFTPSSVFLVVCYRLLNRNVDKQLLPSYCRQGCSNWFVENI